MTTIVYIVCGVEESMKNKPRVLYIEDMPRCYDAVQNALGMDYELDWKKTPLEAREAIKHELGTYVAVILDINLVYDPNKQDGEQTKEGLPLIKLIRKEALRGRNIDDKLPILVATTEKTIRKIALRNGANIVLPYKKALWDGKGKFYLEKMLATRARR